MSLDVSLELFCAPVIGPSAERPRMSGVKKFHELKPETRAYQAGICAVVSKAQVWNLLKSIETAITQSSRELRCAYRYPSVATAQVQSATGVRSARVRDLSIAGAYLAMPNPFSESASILIKISTQSAQREFF